MSKNGKDAYYFPHDSNAKDDPKCVLLIEQLGVEGYGIYWILIELLREQPNYCYPINLIPAIARRYNTTTEKVKAVIGGYDLFIVEDEKIFFSESLNRRMGVYEKAREQRVLAGKKSAEKRALLSAENNDFSTTVERLLNDCLNGASTSKVKESKVKERKEDKRKVKTFDPPSLLDFENYFTENGYSVEFAKKAFEYYNVADWRDSKGNQVKNWKQKCISVWFKEENKPQQQTNVVANKWNV